MFFEKKNLNVPLMTEMTVSEMFKQFYTRKYVVNLRSKCSTSINKIK
jgi:hypothetical protein